VSILELNADTALAARPRLVIQPSTQPKTSIWKDAAALATAIPRGVGEGVAQVGATVAEIMAGYGDTMARMESGQSLQDRAPNMQSDFADSLRGRGREFRPDAQSATAAEQVLYGFARGATKIVGGAVAGGAPGVVLAGVEEGYTQSGELIAEGVDPTTARKAGAVQGAGLALAALPVAGQTLRATAALYLAGGPGGFMAQQALTREILQRGGYDERAAATDPFDPVGLAVSALVPAPFAVMGLRSARLRADLTREIGAQAYTAPLAPEMTPTAQAVRAAFPREVEDAARVLADVQQRAAANPRPPSDLPAAAAHETALARAEEQMARGEPVQVADVAPSDDAASFWASLPARALAEPGAVAPQVLTAAEREANLAAFMQGSKVVDEQGAPLRVFHGTAADVQAFAPERSADGVFHFATDPELANRFAASRAMDGGRGANVLPVYVALRNPKEVARINSLEIADARAEGYDGLISRETGHLVAFSPEQVKSAIGNSGRFDPNSPSLTDPPTEFATNLRAAAAEASTTQTDLTLAEQQFPDLMVQMDGMDKPVPAAELLRAVREQAARDQQDGDLLMAAAQCAIVNGF